MYEVVCFGRKKRGDAQGQVPCRGGGPTDGLQHIGSTIPDEDTCDELELESDGYGSRALLILFTRAEKVSTASGTNIETSMNDMIKVGCGPSVVSFNAWESTYSALNQSQQSQAIRTPPMLAKIYVQVVKACGDEIESRLESMIDYKDADGDLSATLNTMGQERWQMS